MNIAGKVVNEKTGTPIDGANVDIFEGETVIAGVTSSGDGGFQFTSETDYAGHLLKVVVTKQGFETVKQDIRADGQIDLQLKLKEVQRSVVAPIKPATERQATKPVPWWIFVVGVLVVGGIIALFLMPKKKPPVQPAPTKPTVTLTLNPIKISQGEKATLAWRSTDADSVEVSSIGKVALNGSTNVSPPAGTHRYTANATDSRGGSASDEVNLTVSSAPVPKHANLSIKSVKVKSTLFEREKIIIEVVVKNSGPGKSGPFNVNARGRLNYFRSVTDQAIADSFSNVPILPGQEVTLTLRSADNDAKKPGSWEIYVWLSGLNSSDTIDPTKHTRKLSIVPRPPGK